jgi:MFS family permease
VLSTDNYQICAIGMLGLFYMMANLDRYVSYTRILRRRTRLTSDSGNLGNANIAGMSEELGLVGNQFGTAVTLLYVTYVTIEAPTAILLKIIGPRHLLAGCALGWGATCLGMGFIQNVGGLYACRLLIGFFEAAIFPCIDVYIGMVYKKSERGQRAAAIFAFSALSSAFGGLLAFGLTQIHGPNGFSGWRWLFIVEGIITILIVPLYWFVFPNDARTAWFLTEDEKRMVCARYALNPHWGIDDEFKWGAIVDVLKDPKFYAL